MAQHKEINRYYNLEKQLAPERLGECKKICQWGIDSPSVNEVREKVMGIQTAMFQIFAEWPALNF